MKKYTDDVLLFRIHVGSGEWAGVQFELGIAATPDGTPLGMPIVTLHDGCETSVVFEMEDIIPMAFECLTAMEG